MSLIGIIDGNASIVLDLELTCPVFPLSSYLLMLLFPGTYYEQNGPFYIQKNM